MDPSMLTGTSSAESGLLHKFTMEKLTIASRGSVLCDSLLNCYPHFSQEILLFYSTPSSPLTKTTHTTPTHNTLPSGTLNTQYVSSFITRLYPSHPSLINSHGPVVSLNTPHSTQHSPLTLLTTQGHITITLFYFFYFLLPIFPFPPFSHHLPFHLLFLLLTSPASFLYHNTKTSSSHL